MFYLAEMDAHTGLINPTLARTKGQELHEQYRAARPFPHAVIDHFLPETVLQRCLAEFPAGERAERVYDASHERYKRNFNPDQLPAFARQLFYSLNSRPFLRLLENISGIRGLIPDPLFLGGGLHEISQGGHLSVHADFNHHQPLNLERRINVLIYLNRDWKREYGGALELWDRGMSGCEVEITPEFNRCVIFDTSSDSFHGNPQPVNHPQATPRRSIALYYYTSTWSDARRAHSTLFRQRPGTDDVVHRPNAARELLRDLTPPLVLRAARKLRRSLVRDAHEG
jgi:Rps23 Pro-64 3,4-dihydroxylase Tpa1-like proline 4-hydroxylase